MPLKFYTYNLSFTSPFRWKSGNIDERQGLLIRYQSDHINSWGEAAPLLGVSSFSTSEIINKIDSQLSRNIQRCVERDITYKQWIQAMEPFRLPPSLRFGVDMLFIHTQAQRQHVTPSRYLYEESLSDVLMNATLGIQSIYDFIDKADINYNRGFRTFKCKIGENFETDFKRLQRLRNRYPGISLRVDANEAWSPEEARKNLEKLSELDLEYCEQPLSADQWSELKELNQDTAVPIALDESISDFEDLRYAIEHGITDHLVIKPMKLGAIYPLLTLGQKALDEGITLIFSSLLDSGLARYMSAVIAGGLSDPETAHGLATGNYFESDPLPIDDDIKHGRYALPTTYPAYYKLVSNIEYSSLTEL